MENEAEPIRPYVSDQTAFMRWSTELEKIHDIIDKEFLYRNRHRVMDINKILPLSFISNPKAIKLFHLRRQLIELSKDAGLDDLADATVLDNLADYQTTRGTNGNYQNALITTKREWLDRTHSNKNRGLWGKLVKGNDRQNEEGMQAMEGY
ncbi:MAG: hypothetical protein GF350_11990 [Chitinivibrionales bacterium]|nr:hypothetical protein [Chitinivibrionales bacterium]